MIVVDTNVIAYLVIRHEISTVVDRLLERDSDWHAPRLWRSELRNVLTLHVRLRELSLDDAKEHWRLAEVQMKDREHEIDSHAVLECAVEFGASAYDCEFIVLARVLHVPLVTADRKLNRLFPDTAYLLADFVR